MPQCSRLLAKGFLYCFVFLFIKFGSLVTEKVSAYTLIFEKVAVLYRVYAISKTPYIYVVIKL